MFYGLYCRLNIHVMRPDMDVIRAMRRMWPAGERTRRDLREGRHFYYRKVLAEHHKARELFLKHRF